MDCWLPLIVVLSTDACAIIAIKTNYNLHQIHCTTYKVSKYQVDILGPDYSFVCSVVLVLRTNTNGAAEVEVLILFVFQKEEYYRTC